jgi:uncharacterized membrane protein YtjA (UPF0391 family)
MVGWALRFLIAAILATLVAYSGIGYGAAVVAKIIVVILLVLCTVSLVAALRRGR